jgi:phosphoribosylformylglycinamidine synthase I
MIKVAVVVFEGTNCEEETLRALRECGYESEYVWSNLSISLSKYDAIVLPGGFSYGDYLRSGALARFTPIMKSVEKYIAEERGVVLGICNGFQILTEAGLLPGAFIKNSNGKFVCKMVDLKTESDIFPFNSVTLYVAHGDGNYVVNEDDFKTLKRGKRILFTYKENPNGSFKNIAGVANEKFNVFGMMPHPERSVFEFHENQDGLKIFKAVVESKFREGENVE